MIRQINFGVINYCQFFCTYCALTNQDNKDRNKPENYDEVAIAKELKRRGLLAKDLTVVTAPGEIAVNPHKDKYYDFIEENASIAYFDSNAGKFDPRLARILSLSPRNGMVVSLDAGTEETFRKVRGVDLLRQVVSNLKEYRKYTSQIFLKYILLDDNCSDADLDGFIRICADLQPHQIMISGDVRKSSNSWTGNNRPIYEENIVRAALKLAKGAIDSHLVFDFTDHLGPNNLKEIYCRFAELPEVLSAKQQFDAVLSVPKIVCYGAGGNCEIVLSQMAQAGLRMPDVIWDRNAQPGQRLCIHGHDYPVCLPDFDALTEEYGVFSTITNYEVNQKLDMEMKSHGYSDLFTYNRLFLALMAKKAKTVWG